MIRINLLTTERPLAKAAPSAGFALVGRQLTMSCMLILVAGLGIIGWRYQAIQQDSSKLNTQIGEAQTEIVQLRSVLVEVQKFEQRRTQLQQRVGLIETLRKDQTGPAHMLDEISRAMPPTLWLTDLKQSLTAGDVLIEGRCTSLTGITDFVGSLERSGYFKKSVEIVSTQLEVAPTGPDLIKFSIKAQLNPPAVAAPEAAKATPRPAN
jgi:type IV pilus assembly protein PilN